jgi:ABC-type transport system involved in Fe-S cluster assembly fused permease/ATPase subunit
VLQDTILFGGTIRDNIAYGRLDATPEKIIEAAKMANAHDFISAMPHGYDSTVGERGLTLSGGQRQRIGIARAVVRNSPILILERTDCRARHRIGESRDGSTRALNERAYRHHHRASLEYDS